MLKFNSVFSSEISCPEGKNIHLTLLAQERNDLEEDHD